MTRGGRLSPFAQWRVLSAEAIADAVRRRIVPVVIVLALLSLLGIDSCSSCVPTAAQNGRPVEQDALRGGFALFATLCLTIWTLILAGVLASWRHHPLDRRRPELVQTHSDWQRQRGAARCGN